MNQDYKRRDTYEIAKSISYEKVKTQLFFVITLLFIQGSAIHLQNISEYML